MLKTFEEACDFVLENKVVTIFGSKNSPFPSLWDNTALSEEKPKEGGWCEKMVAVWAWKNKIPGTLPDEIFYGNLLRKAFGWRRGSHGNGIFANGSLPEV